MKDIEYYKKRFYLFYNYLVKKNGPNFFLDQTKEMFELAIKKKDIKHLARIDKELNVWLREMFMPSEKEEMVQILNKELKEDTEFNFLNQVSTIISRCKIKNKAEYEIILQRVESIYENKNMKSEVKKLNKLLADYHKQ